MRTRSKQARRPAQNRLVTSGRLHITRSSAALREAQLARSLARQQAALAQAVEIATEAVERAETLTARVAALRAALPAVHA